MSTGTKQPYDHALAVAEEIVEKLRPVCERIEIAGSIRRGRNHIGDIEIVALPAPVLDLIGDPVGGYANQRRKKQTQLDHFFRKHDVPLIKDGPLQKQFSYAGFQVDLFLPASAAHWGAIYQIRTGSHDFNLWVQSEHAPAVGVRFHQGLLYRRLGNSVSTLSRAARGETYKRVDRHSPPVVELRGRSRGNSPLTSPPVQPPREGVSMPDLITWSAYRRLAVTPAGWRYDSPGVYVRENGEGIEEEFHPYNYSPEHGMEQWEYLAGLSLDPDGRLLPAPEGSSEIMAAIARLTEANTRPPTVRELVEVTDITSTSVAHKRLEALRTAGWVDWEDEQCRTLHTTTEVVLDPAGGPGHVERHGEVVATVRPVTAACPACNTPNPVPLPMPEPGVYECRHCAGRAPAEAWV